MSFFNAQDLRKLDNLELLAKQVVEGFIIGLHKSPFHGFSVEFAEHRLYNPGEPTKNIDWKVFARSDKLFVKKFEEETNLRCHIVIDTSSSMYFPKERASNEFNKLQFSAVAAASLMNLLKKQRDAFGLSLFDDELKIHSKDKSSTVHYQLMLSHLDKLINDDIVNKNTSTAKMLHTIADSIHKRSMVIIFSDMFSNNSDQDELFSALQHLKYAKHEVVLFHVLDSKYELDFDFQNRPYLFVDMETGEEIKLQSNELKNIYTKKTKELKDALHLKCLQYKIDYIEADIRKGFHPILETYLVKRKRMMT